MRIRSLTTLFLLMFCMAVLPVAAQTTAFNFQGRLLDNSLPPTANYDLEFKLFDAATNGNELGFVSRPNVAVNAGVFSVVVDFGAQFDGSPRFLEIAVKPSGSPDPLLVLSPRQPISSTPYSIRSLNATAADMATDSSQLGGVAAGDYVVTSDFRLTNERAPAAGSQNYIQNASTVQNFAEFNIGGTGRAGLFDTPDGYQINGLKVLGITGNTSTLVGWSAGHNSTGTGNTFVGAESGSGNTTGANNSYFGYQSGNTNQTSGANSFFGFRSGFSNTSIQNSFFGHTAGQNHTTGFNNSFFGERSGFNSSTASSNSFFGSRAGFSTTEGGANSFFGARAGDANTTGLQNVFMGFNSGFSNTVGDRNVFVGQSAGFSSVSGINNTFVGQAAGTGNETGSHNVALGSGSGFAQPGLTFATAIGPGTLVSTNNTIQLGRSTQEELVLIPGDLQVNGTITGNFILPAGSSNYIQNTASQQAASNFNISGSGSASIFRASTQFNIANDRILSSPGTLNTFVGINNGSNISSGERNTFVGRNTGPNTTSGSANTFVGSGAGFENTLGANNSFFGYNAGLRVTSGGANSAFGVSAGSANLTGVNNSYFGHEAGLLATTNDNSFFGKNAGRGTTSGSSNSFVGVDAGISNTTGINNSALGRGANFGSGNLNFATAIGAGTVVSSSNTVAIGRLNGADAVVVPGNLSIGGSSQGLPFTVQTPSASMSILECGTGAIGLSLNSVASDCSGAALVGNASGNVTIRAPLGSDLSLGTGGNYGIRITGLLVEVRLAGLAGSEHVCRNVDNILSACSSSIRYKSNITDYKKSFDLLSRLRPVRFNWKRGGMLDVGLVAEEVAEIEPLLATYNDKGEVEGVKYDRIGVVLINVVKEQQRQIEELKALVCELKPNAKACRKQ